MSNETCFVPKLLMPRFSDKGITFRIIMMMIITLIIMIMMINNGN